MRKLFKIDSDCLIFLSFISFKIIVLKVIPMKSYPYTLIIMIVIYTILLNVFQDLIVIVMVICVDGP